MEKINVEIHWEEKNFSCGWANEEIGAVISTNKTLDGLKRELPNLLKNHIRSMVEAGESVPEWLKNGEYEVEYTLSASAIIRDAERYTTMAAISRATGINHNLLSQYANNLKVPRPKQRERIVSGLHKIGEMALAIR